jgi:uncharacterized protein YPO0396
MANLSDETIATVFDLQRRLFGVINQSTAAEFNLATIYGETEETLPELEELQNIKERGRDSYNRLSVLLLTIGEAQPEASRSTLDLLYRSIEQANATIEALEASTQEIKTNWNLS